MHILLVEDDPKLAEVVVSGLRSEGMDVVHVSHVSAAAERIALGAYDIIVLDVMLPGGSGVELCRHARQYGVTTPVLMLTARSEIEHRVTGLNAGADDYLAKPFAFAELVARLRALARRPSMLRAAVVIAIGDLVVDTGAHQVRRGDRSIALTTREFALLECLVRHAGVVVDRSTLLEYVWDANHDPFTNALEVLVSRLRAKIDDPFSVKLIHTVRGVGYRCLAQTELVTQNDPQNHHA